MAGPDLSGQGTALSNSDVAEATLPLINNLERSDAAAARMHVPVDQVVSPAGAVGRYQIMPSTAALYGYDPAQLGDPDINRAAATDILTDLAGKFGRDPAVMAVGYNGGPGRANRLVRQNGDPAGLPAETQDYYSRALDQVRNGAPVADLSGGGTPVTAAPDLSGGGVPVKAGAAAPGPAEMRDHTPAERADMQAQVDKLNPRSFMDQLQDYAPKPSGTAADMAQAEKSAQGISGFVKSLFAGDAPLPQPGKPQDTNGQTALKFFQNIPSSVAHAIGGNIQHAGEAAPQPNIMMGAQEADELENGGPQVQTPAGPKPMLQAAREASGISTTGKAIAAAAQQHLKDNAPNLPANSVKQYAYDIASGLTQMAPLMAASALTKNPAPMLIGMAGQSYGDTYANSRAAGRAPDQANSDALFSATANTIPAMLPLHAVMKDGGTFLGKTLATAGAATVQNELTSILQMGYDKGVLKKDMTWGEASQELIHQGIVGLGLGGLLGVAAHVGAKGAAAAAEPGAAPAARVEPAPATGAPGAESVPVEPQAAVPAAAAPPEPAAPIEPIAAAPEPAPAPAGPAPVQLQAVHDPATWAQTGWMDPDGKILPLAASVDGTLPVSDPVAPPPAQPAVTVHVNAPAAAPGPAAEISQAPTGIEAPVSGQVTPDQAKAALATNIDPATGTKPKGNAAIRDLRSRMQEIVDTRETVQQNAPVGTQKIQENQGSGVQPVREAPDAGAKVLPAASQAGDAVEPPAKAAAPADAKIRVQPVVRAEGAGNIPDANPPDSKAFNPQDHVDKLRSLIQDRSKPLTNGAIAKHLGLEPVQAQRVVSRILATTDSGVRQSKAGLRRASISSAPNDAAGYLSSLGGIRDDEGHDLVKGRGLQQMVPGHGPLIRKGGMSIDAAGEKLWNAGFFGNPDHTPRPSENDVLQLMERTGRGANGKPTKVYADADQAGLDQERIGDQAEEANASALEDIHKAARAGGEALTDDEAHQVLAEMGEHGMDPESAVAEHIERKAMRDVGSDHDATEDYPEAKAESDAGAAPAVDRRLGPGVEGREVQSGAESRAAASREPTQADPEAQGALATEKDDEGLDQTIVPGADRSARQLAQAREAQGHGRSTSKVRQKAADDGLFGGPPEEELPFARRDRKYPMAPKSEWYGDANYEKTGGKITEMSPDDFLKQVRPLKMDETSRDNIDDLKRHIESGKTLDPLKIDAKGKEDGRHRAMAAKELGIKKVPVLRWDSEDLKFARRDEKPGDAPAFYSALTRGVEGIKMERAPADQWRNTIKNLAGVKQEEVDWSGLHDWLADQKGSVTKADVLQHLRDNEVQIHEVTKGGDDSLPRYKSHKLPGGENYRELLLTKPSKGDALDARRREIEAKGKAATGAERREWADIMNRLKPDNRDIEGIQRFKGKDFQDYKSGHWDEPNILAHVRFDDRTGPNGEKILHVAEVQSDWHQSGRRHGYTHKEADKEKLYQQVEAARQEYIKSRADGVKAETGGKYSSGKEILDAGDTEAYRAVKDADERPEVIEAEKRFKALRDQADKQRLHSVPDAPFKTTWHELALKRMVRYAAEHGYDKLSWDKGETQAARYDLSKQVNEVNYFKEPEGTYSVGLVDKDGKEHTSQEYTAEELPGAVGKDLADKIIKGEGDGPDDGIKRFTGLDLKVGGEGMKGFYDKIVPNFMAKYGKKFGARVGETTVEKGGEPTHEYVGPEPTQEQIDTVAKAVRERGSNWDSPITGERQDYVVNRVANEQSLRQVNIAMDDGATFKQAMDDHGNSDLAKIFGGDMKPAKTKTEREPVHSIDITPAMRDSAMQGQPMFAAREETLGQGAGQAKLSYSEAFDAKRAEVEADLRARLDKLGLKDVALKLPDSITAGGDAIDGVYSKKIIHLALDVPEDGRNGGLHNVMDHESIHAMKRMGLFKDLEWRALTNRAADWAKRYSIEDRYKGVAPDQIQEEAIAHAFADWRDGKLGQAGNAIQRIFRKVQNFLEAVRNTFQGAGFRSADDVFRSIDKGELGSRGLDEPDQKGPAFAKRDQDDQTKTPEFKRWFGKSKVVDKDGAPQRVFHGTNQNIESFSSERLGNNTGAISAKAFFFTDHPVEAGEYADMSARKQVSNAPEREANAARLLKEMDRALARNNHDLYERLTLELEASEEEAMGGEDRGANIIPAYLKIEKPLAVDMKGGADLAVIEKAIKSAKAKGYDGLRLDNVFDPVSERPGLFDTTQWVAFKPEQIKSAVGNRGTFDPEDSRIDFARRGKKQEKKPEPEPEQPKSLYERTIGKHYGHIMGEGAAKVQAHISAAIDRFVPESVRDAGNALKMAVAPMAHGSVESRAAAKDFANGMRKSRVVTGRQMDYLEKNFDPKQLAKMWEAADEESVLRQQGKEPGPNEGLNRLAPNERAAVEAYQAGSDVLLKQAKKIGLFKGEGLPSYVPRMVVALGADGSYGRLESKSGEEVAHGLDAIGKNLKVSSANLKQRKYLTAAETEAAAKGINAGAVVVKDFRTLPLAMGRLQEAIQGRTLINKIREIGRDTGQEIVSEGSEPDKGDGPGFFTIDHPAFKTYRPKLVMNEETGKPEALNDENGEPIMERVPLYIRKDFEGPLRAVLSTKTGAIYNAAMGLKGKLMSVIMYSPLMHNMVIWGKAVPAAPLKLINPLWRGADGKMHLSLELYGRGRAAKNDTATMKEALDNGLDPVGHRYFNQDASAIMETPSIKPGRSWTAKLLGYVPGLFDKEMGENVKRRIDQAGDVWHNKLLWDLVGDLQMGLYTHLRDKAVKDGNDPQTAGRMAAHFANRYAGALPIESMSKIARQTANMLLFSRSFTLTNLGAFKDMVAGLPQDVQSQILRDKGVAALNKIQGTARRKAVAMLAMDVFLSHAGLFLVQHALAWLASRPYTSPSQNEPGKENRFLIGYQKDGTAIYGRLPIGKVGEEYGDWATSPLELGKRKLSPYGRLLYGMASNDQGFGRKIYDPYDTTPVGMAKNIGRITSYAAETVSPISAFQGLFDVAKKKGDQETNWMKVLLPLAGITVSKGAPGGPGVGQLYASKDEHEFQVGEAMPDIREKIASGDIPGAQEQMAKLGMSRSYQKFVIKTTLNPGARLSKGQIKEFMGYASPEEKARMRGFMGQPEQAPEDPEQHSENVPDQLQKALKAGELEKFADAGGSWTRQDAIRAASAAGLPATAALLRDAKVPMRTELRQKLLGERAAG